MVTRTSNLVGIEISSISREKFVVFREFLRQSNIPLNYKNWGETHTNGHITCWGYFTAEQVNMMETWITENAKEVYSSVAKVEKDNST